MSLKSRWYALRAKFSTAQVVLLITDSKLSCARGKLPPSMLKDLAEIIEARKIGDALILVSKGRNDASFSFSAAVDDSTRQRFRNIWFAYPERKIMGV